MELLLTISNQSAIIAVLQILKMFFFFHFFFPKVSKITFLGRLESSFKTTWKSLPLLVKIIHKSRLRYYGKHGLKIDYPYQVRSEIFQLL